MSAVFGGIESLFDNLSGSRLNSELSCVLPVDGMILRTLSLVIYETGLFFFTFIIV